MMKYTDNALNILTVKSYKGIGNAWIVNNLGHNESIETIVALINTKCTTSIWEFEQRKKKYKETLLEKFGKFCDGFIAFGDDNFPQHRGKVNDGERPVFLYYKGNIELLDVSNKNISVIGLLNPTEDIEMRERKIVSQLVKNGATIVSGLALGCDSISHSEALNSNGRTIAILPSPLTNILPKSNNKLASQIVEEGGLLISEYGNDFKNKMELNTRYKDRDRLQALFCDSILLISSFSKNSGEKEGHLFGQKLDSGARLAMQYAKNYNIPRAIMYDNSIDENNPMFDLCREIIKESKNESKDIAILTQENYIDKIREIVNKKATVINNPKEKGLFD